MSSSKSIRIRSESNNNNKTDSNKYLVSILFHFFFLSFESPFSLPHKSMHVLFEETHTFGIILIKNVLRIFLLSIIFFFHTHSSKERDKIEFNYGLKRINY